MSSSREIELKLELPSAEVARLVARSLNQLVGIDGARQHLVSIYFDTRKRSLRKHGLSLRVRSDGQRHVQTIKANETTSTSMFDRLEWETEIAGEGPDLKAAAQTPVRAAMGRKHSAKILVPVFQTVVDRTIWSITQNGSEIEVALDEGRVVAAASVQRIAELELELKRGSSADLFALAGSLDCVKTLKIGVRTKSERGYALSDANEPSSFLAESIALKPDMPTGVAFGIIARACIRHFRLNEPLLIANRSAEPLHQVRVAMRRLRAALSLFEPIVTDHEFGRLKRRLREVSHELGEARNLDVYAADTTAPTVGKSGSSPPRSPAARVRAERDLAYENVISMLQSKPCCQLMQGLVAWIEAGPWRTIDQPERRAERDQTIADFAGRVLEHQRQKLKREGRHLDRLSPEQRHRVRIEAKKLRYASEFFSSLSTDRKHRRRHKTFIAALEDLQSCLGDLNDIQTGQKIAAKLARSEVTSAGGFDLVRGTAGHLHRHGKVAFLLHSACKAHRRLMEVKAFWKKAV